MKVALPLAENVLAPLGLTAAMSAIDGSIQKKIHGSGVKLIIEQEDNSIKWTVLAHFLTPNFTPKILTHKILTPNTHA